MKANTASQTAQIMALYRAMETKRPRRKRLFTDPYAIHFLDNRFRLASQLSRWSLTEKFLYRIIQQKIPGALASGLARTRYIDDLLEQSIRDGSRQVIILGAGFDMRAMRLDCLQHIPVIEIDHPDTARSKLQILHSTGGEGGGLGDASGGGDLQSGDPRGGRRVRYLQVDLNKQDLDTFFREQGIDRSIPTTLIWEGVTNYLQKEAIDKTFAVISQFVKGSTIIFTYIHKHVLEDPAAYLGAERLLKDLDDIEEKWTFGFDPQAVPTYLRSFGLELLADKGAAEYRERYLPERKTILKGYEFYRVAMARKVN